MTVPVMVHGRVVCVFSLALLCVSVSATAAEAAGPVEAAKPALKEINTAHAMAGEAVKRTTEFIELLKRANGTILEALKLSQNTLKTAESSVKNPPARKELDAATEGTFKAESQKAATKAKKAAEEVANAVQYVYTAHVVAQWAKGNATKAAGLVKIAALTSANEAVAAAAMNAAETALLATSNGQDVRRWMNASSRMAGWAEDRPDKSKGILAKKAVDISNSAVKFVQNALAISDEALQNADVTLDAAKKAELLAQAVKKEAEGNATEAQKLREQAAEIDKTAQKKKAAREAAKKMAEDLRRKQREEERAERERAKAAASVGLAETEDNGTGDATVSSEAPSPPAAPTGPVAESTSSGDAEAQKYATSTDSVAPIPASADPPQLPATPKSPAGRGIGTGDGSSDVRMRLPPLLMLLGALTYLAL